MTTETRWMVRRDMPEVLDIENRSFEFAWPEEEFVRCLRERNCIGRVADDGGRIVGYMVYELHKNRLRLLNLAVHPEERRCGIGRLLIGDLIGKLNPLRRQRIVLEVRESNLEAQLFFRSLRFEAVSVLRDFYEDTTEDAYAMQYQVRQEVEAAHAD